MSKVELDSIYLAIFLQKTRVVISHKLAEKKLLGGGVRVCDAIFGQAVPCLFLLFPTLG